MKIFYKELSLEEGFEVSDLEKNSRIVAGREVSNASGIALFNSMRGKPITCWHCGAIADRWISCKDMNDISRPVLNLFATRVRRRDGMQFLVMMTRDHIIPKSLGGVDDNSNLRPGCEDCNSDRGSKMDKSDLAFMEANPHLISQARVEKGLANAAKLAGRKNTINTEKEMW